LVVAVLHVAQSAQEHHDNRHHIRSTAGNTVIFQADARSVLEQEGQRRRGIDESTIHAHAGQETLPRKYQSENLNEEDLCTSYAEHMKFTHNGARQTQRKESEFFLFGGWNVNQRTLKSALANGASLKKIHSGTNSSLKKDVDGSIRFPVRIG
jgi:hypothetical protein